MNVCAISPDKVLDVWPEISGGLATVLDKHSIGRWSVAEVLENLQAGEWQLFLVADEGKIIASLICSILPGQRQTLEVGMCWGANASEWIGDVNTAFEQIARETGCDQVALDGRPGWRTWARKYGYELNSVRYVRKING